MIANENINNTNAVLLMISSIFILLLVLLEIVSQIGTYLDLLTEFEDGVLQLVDTKGLFEYLDFFKVVSVLRRLKVSIIQITYPS